jgi:hypothetical protein
VYLLSSRTNIRPNQANEAAVFVYTITPSWLDNFAVFVHAVSTSKERSVPTQTGTAYSSLSLAWFATDEFQAQLVTHSCKWEDVQSFLSSLVGRLIVRSHHRRPFATVVIKSSRRGLSRETNGLLVHVPAKKKRGSGPGQLPARGFGAQKRCAPQVRNASLINRHAPERHSHSA